MISYVDCSLFTRGLLSDCDLPPELQVHVGLPDLDELVVRLAGATVAMDSNTRFDAATLARCPDLRSIVFLGSGAANHIDLAAAAQAGITVRTIKGYGDRSIAEHAFGLALAAARQTAQMDRDLRSGRWEPRDGLELAGCCFGIVGAGGIGREVARIARGFGTKVLVWNPSPLDPELAPHAASMDELLARSDIVSLHLASVDETRGFAGADFFAAIKPGAIFVNTARAALVDEGAMIASLARGRLRHAALDVFSEEPLPHNNPLLGLPNVTLTAHAAYKTDRAAKRLFDLGLAVAMSELRYGV